MIYIIVPTYGRIDDTKKFINCINDALNNNFLIILTDDHPEKLTYKNIEETKCIKILDSIGELWWVGSVNLAFNYLLKKKQLIDNDIVIVANNDVTIDKNSIEVLIKAVNQNSNSIFHPRTFNEDNIEVSSGAKILSLFPYVTKHPKNFKETKKSVDMGTARFLCFSASTLKKVGYITNSLLQYGGDNYFTLVAKKNYNINTYILRDAQCKVDDSNTGIKNMNINSFRGLYNSFFSVRSPNNIKYRYNLFKETYSFYTACFVTFSLTCNTVVKYFLRRVYKNEE